MSNLFSSPFFTALGNTGTPIASARLTFYAAGKPANANILQPVYTTQARTTAHPNPVIADANGRFAPIYLDPSLSYLVVLSNAAGTIIKSTEAVSSTDYVTPADFGADNTGATDTTIAMKAFYDHCIAKQVRGYIPAGTYRIRPGQIILDSGATRKPFPVIETAGHYAVTFKFDNTAPLVDQPMIVITNGRAGSATPGGGGGNNGWQGGSHGGLTIIDEGGVSNASRGLTNRHGLELQGWLNGKLGYILYKANDRPGSAIFVPRALFNSANVFNGVGASNPDPCAISALVIEGVEAQYARYTIENKNYDGFDGVTVNYARGILNSEGGIYGCGQGCHFKSGSFGSCAGWAWDDGTNIDADGGTPNRTIVENFEIDDCQFGIRINRITNSEFRQTRFNHRYNSSFTPLNNGEGFWPRKCIEVASGTSPNISNVTFDKIIHRISPLEAGVNAAGKNGGVAFGKSAMGIFLTTSNPSSIVGFSYDHQVIDAPNFVFTSKDFYSGFTQNSVAVLRTNGQIFFDSTKTNYAVASYSGTTPNVSAGGFGSATSILALNAVRTDKGAQYNAPAFKYRVPYSGQIKLSAQIETTAAIGTRIDLGFASRPKASTGAFSLVATSRNYAVSTGSQTFMLPETSISVEEGDEIVMMAATNLTTSVPLTPTIAASASCQARYEMT
jgi:hypothetical protein